MNKVALVGRLTKDIELRGDGDEAFAKFTVAINRPFKNKKTNEYEADFVSCIAFGKTAEFVSKWFSKGDPLGVTGRIQTGSYENKNGDTVYTTDVVVDAAEFVCGKKENSESSGNSKKSGSSKKKRDYDDDDEEYEKPKKKRKPEPDEEDDDSYPF